jgi:hypothetical protein
MVSLITLILNWNANGLLPLLRQFVLTKITVNEFVDFILLCFTFCLNQLRRNLITAWRFTYHSRNHPGEKSFDCGVCNKRLFQRELTKDMYILQSERTIHMVSNKWATYTFLFTIQRNTPWECRTLIHPVNLMCSPNHRI